MSISHAVVHRVRTTRPIQPSQPTALSRPRQVTNPWLHRKQHLPSHDNDTNLAGHVAALVFECLHTGTISPLLDATLTGQARRTLDQNHRITKLTTVGKQRPRITVESVHNHQLSPGIIESAVSVKVNERIHAVALRLERTTSTWHVTALEVG